ncbi:hypothetical protein [Xanthomonas arboricola]|uniref:hypothetical protein n=1 Tax=Xanthomonas arboricola TaxID=56448 RepID=UPI001612DDD4|nr:hypothetical protein [Xanthomonas arboricola]MBB5859019.1 hypothetical protein [Xanthomonas arboricola]
MSTVYLDSDYIFDVVDASSASASFFNVTQILSKALLDGACINVPENIYQLRNSNGEELYQILFELAENYGLSTEDITSLTMVIDRCFTQSSNVDMDFTVTDAALAQASYCYKPLHNLTSSDAAGILIRSKIPHGSRNVVHIPTKTKRSVFLINKDVDLIAMYRSHIAENNCAKPIYDSYRSRAFPSIIFAPNLSVASLNVDLSAKSVDVVKHLSFLNDRYLSLGIECHWDFNVLKAAAASEGIDFSDESTKTKANVSAMKKRDVTISINRSSIAVRCSLHTKIDPTKGRIHFCQHQIDSQYYVIVGLMKEHLPT